MFIYKYTEFTECETANNRNELVSYANKVHSNGKIFLILSVEPTTDIIVSVLPVLIKEILKTVHK